MKNKVPRNRPYIPKGCDQQGRYPEAAHAASEIDERERYRFWWLDDILWSVGLTAVVLFVLIFVGLFP